MIRRESEVIGRFFEDYDGEAIDTEEGYFVSLRDLVPEEVCTINPGPKGRYRIVVEFEPE